MYSSPHYSAKKQLPVGVSSELAAAAADQSPSRTRSSMAKSLRSISAYLEFRAVQKSVNLVALETCCNGIKLL